MKDVPQNNKKIQQLFEDKHELIQELIAKHEKEEGTGSILQPGTIATFIKKTQIFGNQAQKEFRKRAKARGNGIQKKSRMADVMDSERSFKGRNEEENARTRSTLDKELKNIAEAFGYRFPGDLFSRKIKSFDTLMEAMVNGEWSGLTKCDYFFGSKDFAPEFDLRVDPITKLDDEHPEVIKIVDAFVQAKVEGLKQTTSSTKMRTILEVIYSNTDVDVAMDFPAIAQLAPFRLENSEQHTIPKDVIPDHAICLDTTKYKTEAEIKKVISIAVGDLNKPQQVSKGTKNKLLILYSDYDERYRAINGDYNLSIFKLLEFLTNECAWDCILFSKKLDRSPVYVENNMSVVRRALFLDRNLIKDLKDGPKFQEVIKGMDLEEAFLKRRNITDTPLGKDTFDIVDLLADLFRTTKSDSLKERMNKDIPYITSAIIRDDFLSLGRYLFNISKAHLPFFKLTLSVLVLSKVSLTRDEVKGIIRALFKTYQRETAQFFKVKNDEIPDLCKIFEEDFDHYFGLVAKLFNNRTTDHGDSVDIRPRLKVKMTVAMSNDLISLTLRRIIHWVLACDIATKEPVLSVDEQEQEEQENLILQNRIDSLSHLLASCDIDIDHMAPSVFKPLEEWDFDEQFLDRYQKKNATDTLRYAFLQYQKIEKDNDHFMSNFGDYNQLKKDLVVKFLNAGYPFTVADVARFPQQNYSLPPVSFCLIDSLGKAVMILFEGLMVSALRCQDNGLLESAFSYAQSVVNMCYWNEHTHLPHSIGDISRVLERGLSLSSNTRIEITKLHYMIRTGQLTRAQFVVRRNLCGVLHINTIGGLKYIKELSESDKTHNIEFTEKLTSFFIKSLSQLIRVYIYRMNIYGAARLFRILRAINEKFKNTSSEEGYKFVTIYAQSFDQQHEITLKIKAGDPNKTFFPPIGESMEIYRLCTYIRGLLAAKHLDRKKHVKNNDSVLQEIEENITMNHEIINGIEADLNLTKPDTKFEQSLYETNVARLRLFNLYKTLNDTGKKERSLKRLISERPEFGGVWPGKYLEVLSIYVSCRETLSMPFLTDANNSDHLLKLNYKLNKLLVLCDEFNFALLNINCELLHIINIMLNALNPITYNPFALKIDSRQPVIQLQQDVSKNQQLKTSVVLSKGKPQDGQTAESSAPDTGKQQQKTDAANNRVKSSIEGQVRNTPWEEIDIPRATTKLRKRLRDLDLKIQDYEYYIKTWEFEQVEKMVELFLEQTNQFRNTYHTIQLTLTEKTQVQLIDETYL